MDGWQWHMDGAPDEWGDDSAPPVDDARTELGSASSFTSATSDSDSADAAAAAPLEQACVLPPARVSGWCGL